jgi:hypothetical protein
MFENLGRWPRARVTTPWPRASSPSAKVVGHMRRPVCLIPLHVVAGEKLPPTSTPPRAISPLPLPCHWLPSSAVRTSLAPALYAPPPASSSPPRVPLRPGVPHRPLHPRRRAPLRPFTGTLPSAELTATASPHRWASLHPKPQIGPPSSRACFPTASSLAPAVGRLDFTSEPLVPGGGGRLPLSQPRAERPRVLGHHGRTSLWPNGLSPFQ